MKSGVYKIENQVTEDIYIGSSVDLHSRKSRHFKDLENKKHHSIILQRAVNKYGIINFIFILLEECDKNFLLVREQHYIDTLLPLYNICQIAGNSLGVKHSQESTDKKRKYAQENNIKPPEFTWKDRQRKVYMLDKNTLEVVNEFESLSSACRFIGKQETFVSTISSCCNNVRFSAFGYRWVFFLDDVAQLRDKKALVFRNRSFNVGNRKSKKVKQYDMNNNYIREFNSVKEAEEIFGKGISNCALGRSKSSNNYIWKY